MGLEKLWVWGGCGFRDAVGLEKLWVLNTLMSKLDTVICKLICFQMQAMIALAWHIKWCMIHSCVI